MLKTIVTRGRGGGEPATLYPSAPSRWSNKVARCARRRRDSGADAPWRSLRRRVRREVTDVEHPRSTASDKTAPLVLFEISGWPLLRGILRAGST